MKICALGLVALATLVIRVDAAPILYTHDAVGNLATVDAGTGIVTIIGNMGIGLTDIAFDPDGNLFGVDYNNLYSINPITAATTLIGPLLLPNVSTNALVFRGDGVLFGANNTNLFTVNTATGVATVIGPTGWSAGDLAFNGGALYLTGMSNDLIEVNPGTGAGTIIGPLGFMNVFGLATATDGLLYGATGTKIITINTTTGAGTLLSMFGGQGLGNAYGLAYYDDEVPEPQLTPEPSTLSLSGMLLLFFAGKAYKSRRKS